jgi:glutathione gamma-glutamylcysteinyltransferase
MLCDPKVGSAPEPHGSLYKRPLPASQIPFSSPQGRFLFQEALLAGSMNSYFPLAEQFHTQVEPTYCGISSLVMVLNALQVDPKRLWKGVWRWFSEDVADCCQQLDVIDKTGITLTALATLARCNGLNALAVHASSRPEDLADFRNHVLRICSTPVGDGNLGEAMVLSYSRAILGQTGDGHFSPLGGYHAEQDLVLLLDVARFKYPPHWVPLTLLWEAMQVIDPDTGLARGYLSFQASTPTAA